jgi:starch phosphorylase
VGAENFFLFGLSADEVQATKARGYQPRDVYDATPSLKDGMDFLAAGHFSRGDRGLFAPLVETLLERDEYMLLADYQAYLECQDAVARAYADPERWVRMSILNVARIGRFSSDRAIREYCEAIWGVSPVRIALDGLRGEP